MSQNLRRVYLLVAVVFAWVALALQFYLAVDLYTAGGLPITEAVVRFASFFTVTTNTLVAVLLTLSLIRSPEHGPRPSTMAAATVYIVIVGIIYYLLLAKSWNPQGLQLVANVGLHYVMPAVMTIYWLLFVPKGETRWGQAVRWLIYPLAYFAFTLAEGLRVHWYPYPFVDVTALGYIKVAINGAALLIFFYVLNLIMIALDKTLGRAAIRQTA